MENRENNEQSFENHKAESIDSLPLVLRIDDLMLVLKVGRNTAYALVRSNQIRVIRIGKQIRIPREEVIRFLAPHDL